MFQPSFHPTLTADIAIQVYFIGVSEHRTQNDNNRSENATKSQPTFPVNRQVNCKQVDITRNTRTCQPIKPIWFGTRATADECVHTYSLYLHIVTKQANILAPIYKPHVLKLRWQRRRLLMCIVCHPQTTNASVHTRAKQNAHASACVRLRACVCMNGCGWLAGGGGSTVLIHRSHSCLSSVEPSGCAAIAPKLTGFFALRNMCTPALLATRAVVELGRSR